MIVRSVRFQNYRGISQLEVPLHPALTVLCGWNGAGKSTILDGLATLLSWLPERIRAAGGAGHHFSPSDIRNHESWCAGAVTVDWNGAEYSWELARTRPGRERHVASDLSQLSIMAGKVRDPAGSTPFPIAMHYPVHRAVLDIPLRIRKRHSFDDRVHAWDQALFPGANFRAFFEWFREREDFENQERASGKDFRDRDLNAVREAVQRFTGFTNLRVDRRPLAMKVEKAGQTLAINQLSDGEECLLAMVGDIARRLAIAHPSLPSPCRGPAVVLIDEIDLHLHPEWQQKTIRELTRTFEKCQFVVTTHSPAVLTNVRPAQIFRLRNERGEIRSEQPAIGYGWTADSLLEDVFEAPPRSPEAEARLASLHRSIDNNDLSAARTQLAALQSEVGRGEPRLVRAAH